jgi:hypothetical protein
VSDKEATPKLVGPLQRALNKRGAGSMDHRPATAKRIPSKPLVEILVSGQADADLRAEIQDIRTLRTAASQAMDVVRESPGVAVLRMFEVPTAHR